MQDLDKPEFIFWSFNYVALGCAVPRVKKYVGELYVD